MMRPESAPYPTSRELLIVCKSGGNDPKYAYVSILEGFGRVFGKFLLKNLFNGDPHLSREHFQISFVNGHIYVTQISTNNSTLIRDTNGQVHELRQGTRERVEVRLKATIQAGRSFFRVEEILPGQQILPPSDLIQTSAHQSSGNAQASQVLDTPAPAPIVVPVPPPVVAPPAVKVAPPVEVPPPAGASERFDLRKGSQVADETPSLDPRRVPPSVAANPADSGVPESSDVGTSPESSTPDSTHSLQSMPQPIVENEPPNEPSTGMFDSGDFGFSMDDDDDRR